MLDAARLTGSFFERFGVPLNGEAADGDDGPELVVRPADLSRTQGFEVKVVVGWRTVQASFVPGTFAATLLAQMAASTPSQRATFATFIRTAREDGAAVEMQINNQTADLSSDEQWPAAWRSCTMSIQKGPMVINGSDPDAIDGLVLLWGGRMLGAALALLPLEAVEPAGEVEGGGHQVLITRYERSQINRAACLEFHGYKCKICGFDFEGFYGPLGHGFIEVHHIEMVSALEPDTVVNPVTDLIPVCSNCHSMLHKRTPPYLPGELHKIVEARRLVASPV